MTKKALVILFVLLAVVPIITVQGKAQELTLQEELTPQVDTLQQIIDLVVENNPILQSQRELLKQIQALPNPGKGFDFQFTLRGGMSTYVDEDKREIYTAPSYGVGIEIPLFSSSRRKERIMDRLTYAKELEKAEQDYLRLKNSIISELLTKLNRLFELENEKKKMGELKSFLGSNIESLKQQVKAGVIEARNLWDLTERIMDTETKIYNRSSELEILKREIAINLGGEKCEELRQMLDELNSVEEKNGK